MTFNLALIATAFETRQASELYSSDDRPSCHPHHLLWLEAGACAAAGGNKTGAFLNNAARSHDDYVTTLTRGPGWERAQVRRWEALHARQCGEPRLKRFQGRPNDYSPKARLLNMLGYKLPFDRHDWVVDRCGRDVRCAHTQDLSGSVAPSQTLPWAP